MTSRVLRRRNADLVANWTGTSLVLLFLYFAMFWAAKVCLLKECGSAASLRSNVNQDEAIPLPAIASGIRRNPETGVESSGLE